MFCSINVDIIYAGNPQRLNVRDYRQNGFVFTTKNGCHFGGSTPVAR